MSRRRPISDNHPVLSSVSLRAHLSRTQSVWAVVFRKGRADAYFDYRRGSGPFELGECPPGVPYDLHVLAQALQAAYRHAGASWPEASREPLGAVGGGSQALRRQMEMASGVSTAGQPLDETGAQR